MKKRKGVMVSTMDGPQAAKLKISRHSVSSQGDAVQFETNPD